MQTLEDGAIETTTFKAQYGGDKLRYKIEGLASEKIEEQIVE